ncbi:hypothetical protein FRAHR75_510032 [Frankia sp. Hr75.2]|nr:hypothetical protein FRAHR75_510032 [Frankia sp. Hr75.2]
MIFSLVLVLPLAFAIFKAYVKLAPLVFLRIKGVRADAAVLESWTERRLTGRALEAPHRVRVRFLDAGGAEREGVMPGDFAVGSTVPVIYFAAKPENPMPAKTVSNGRMVSVAAVALLLLFFAFLAVALFLAGLELDDMHQDLDDREDIECRIRTGSPC